VGCDRGLQILVHGDSQPRAGLALGYVDAAVSHMLRTHENHISVAISAWRARC